MSAPEWTHLILYNSQLKHDGQSSPIDPTVDKEDWDEVAQILFAEGKGWSSPEGKKEWNVILKQMGLAKGLMGFMSMIESQSFPGSSEDEDAFQIIHSKRRVTCIYQMEPDYCIVAVFTLPEPRTPSNTANASSSRQKQETSPPKPVVATDEQYKLALTKACDRYLLTNGSPALRMKNDGRANLVANLESFWTSWMVKHSRISAERQSPSVSQSKMDQTCLEAWSELVKQTGNQREEKECVLLSHEGVLLTSGSILAEASLIDYLENNLHQLSPQRAKGVHENDAPRSGARKHAHEYGTWKKLGLGSWGSSVGFGVSDESSSNVELKKQDLSKRSSTKGKLEESAHSGGVKWGGIGQWLGISSPLSGTTTSEAASPSTNESSVSEYPHRQGPGRSEVDLASLNSALDSELGGSGEPNAGGVDQAFSWTQESLWLKAGTVAITISYTTDRGMLFACATQGHDAGVDIFPGIDQGLVQTLFSSKTAQVEDFSTTQPTTQFDDRKARETAEEVKYHNPLQLEIRDTPKAGRGVFAPSDIPAGTILEESPVLILTRAEWDEGRLDNGVLGGYAFNWSNGGMAIGLGIACMFNHSPKPNVNFIRRAPNTKSPNVEPAIVFMTSRRIKKGEELYICYGHESKLWFLPDYDNTLSQSGSADQENEVEDAATFLSGFDGLVALAESQNEEAPGSINDHTIETLEAEAKPVENDNVLHRAAISPQATVEKAEGEEPLELQIILDDPAENEDDSRRSRKSEKKALQEEKAAKYRQKKAAQAAMPRQRAPQAVELAPPLVLHPMIDQATTCNSKYQEALGKLHLVPGIEISPDDIKAIEMEEAGQPEFEGAHGFSGWRRVKRVPGLSLGGEAPLESTLQVWAVEVPSQMIGKLTQYIRHRKLIEDELAHLKRIYKNLLTGMTLIALYLTSKMSEEDVRNDLKDYDPALSDIQLMERAVPARAAHSMKEVELLKPLWPVALRQRPVLAADRPWSASRKAWVKNGILEVVKLAKQQKAAGELCVAVFATSAPKAAQLHDPDAVPPTPDIRAVGIDTRRAAGHPLRHATISCVTEIANLRTMSPFADVLATRNGAGYLLTSLSVFMTHEPCVMCAMSLVHSRVKEVFYLTGTRGSSKGGGFEGSYPVHSHPGLNHQMDLFDCSELVSGDDLKELIITEVIDI